MKSGDKIHHKMNSFKREREKDRERGRGGTIHFKGKR